MERGKLITGILLVVLVIALGIHYGPQLHSRIVEIENWIAGLGVWGPLAFLGLFIVLTSVFFPDSVLSATAGVLFGPGLGLAVVLLGAIIVQSIAFGLSRYFFLRWVQNLVANRPKLAAIQRAANQHGFRLQLLLRLVPLNPVLVSYVVATTGTRFGVFLLACFGLIPGLFVQVYCGYTARHMIKVAGTPDGHSSVQTFFIGAGFVACLVLLVMVTRLAQKAIAKAEQ